MTPPLALGLTWRGDPRLAGSAGDATFVLDGRQRVGPSPVHALALRTSFEIEPAGEETR